MDCNCKLLVLKKREQGEHDKVITCLSDKLGKLQAKVKGVNKAGAKFQFACQPFCFFDAVLNKHGDFYTVISAAPIDMFFDIVSDLDRLYAGGVMLEAADNLTRFDTNSELLPIVLTGLKQLNYTTNLDTVAVALLTLSKELHACGYRFQLDHCVTCGAKIQPQAKYAIEFSAGGITCVNCQTATCKSMLHETYQALSALQTGTYNELTLKRFSVAEKNHLIGLYDKYFKDIVLCSLLSLANLKC